MKTLQDAVNASLEFDRLQKEEEEKRRAELIGMIKKDIEKFFKGIDLCPSNIWTGYLYEIEGILELPKSELCGFASFPFENALGEMVDTVFAFPQRKIGESQSIRISAGKCPDCLVPLWSFSYYNVGFKEIGDMVICPSMPQRVCETEESEKSDE